MPSTDDRSFVTTECVTEAVERAYSPDLETDSRNRGVWN